MVGYEVMTIEFYEKLFFLIRKTFCIIEVFINKVFIIKSTISHFIRLYCNLYQYELKPSISEVMKGSELLFLKCKTHIPTLISSKLKKNKYTKAQTFFSVTAIFQGFFFTSAFNQ